MTGGLQSVGLERATVPRAVEAVELRFEAVELTGAVSGYLYRARVPGGWILCRHPQHMETSAFIPDPRHEWG